MNKIFKTIKRFFTWKKKTVSTDQEIFMRTIGAIFLQEYSKDRTFRRKVKGTDFEKRINQIIN
jgi:hypothetical protein